MVVNQSARNVRLLIGGANFTPCLISFQGSDSHLDQSGLVSFTGSILLGKALGFSQSLDDRKNPTRFCRGVPVILEIANTANTLARHPRGALRILTAKYDLELQQLTLEVGDLIALLNFKEPTDPDKAENKCEGKRAEEIVIKLLNLAGITAIAGDLPTAIYHYPLNLSGSYLQSAGKLLYANNRFGWIDKNEVFQIRVADIAMGGGGVNIVVGRDDIWYKRLDGAEAICETIKAIGTEMIARPIGDTEDVSEEYGPASTVGTEYSSNQIIVIQKTIRTQKWNKSLHRLRTITEIYRPYGLVIPEVFWGIQPPKLRLILAEEIIEDAYFENNSECKLKLKETKTYQPVATYLAEYKEAKPNFFSSIVTLSLTKKVAETYEYDAKERIKKINSTTQELQIIILNGTDENWDAWELPPTGLVPSERVTQEWKELNKDNWRYSNFGLQSLVRVNPELVKFFAGSETISNKTDLIANPNNSVTRTSNSGQETPPAAERCPGCATYEENNIEEEAKFFDPCLSDLKQRERTFSVDMLASRKERILNPGEIVIGQTTGSNTPAAIQLRALAQREGRLLRGRSKGQELAMAMVSGIFNYYPLYPVRATELDSTIQNYLADGCSWVVSQSKALWSCDGIWVGYSFGSVVIPPYTEPSLNYLGLGLGLEIKGYAYTLEAITQQIELGMGMGIEITQLTWETVDWDTTDENIWNSLGNL